MPCKLKNKSNMTKTGMTYLKDRTSLHRAQKL